MNRLKSKEGLKLFNEINQPTQYTYTLTFFGKSSISLTFFGKRSTSLTFLGYFEQIHLIQSYQSLKVNRLNHLLYENELTQSPINSLGEGTESIQSILCEKIIHSNQSIKMS